MVGCHKIRNLADSPSVMEVRPFTACDAFLTAPLKFWNCGVPAPPERDLKEL